MYTILIIDDEQRIRKIYKQVFHVVGRSTFKVLESEGVQEALDLLISEDVDLILLDIRMGDINGQEMYDVIKEYNPFIKIIIASVYPVEEQKRLIPFADGYYDKSWGPIKLIEEVAGSFV